MEKRFPSQFLLHQEVTQALRVGYPIVALESTVITHGLPHPENLQLANDIQAIIKQQAVPATIALLGGKIKIGLTPEELKHLASLDTPHKISTRDISIGISNHWNGGTTVSATLFVAHSVGIKIFATGGIGGVHRGNPFDVSADLQALSQYPLVVVCSGAKAILDLPATREKLETLGIPVIGYQTNEFPAFFSTNSGLPVDFRAESASEIAVIAQNHWDIQRKTAVLVVNPPPKVFSLPFDFVEDSIQKALEDAAKDNIQGSKITPFLLNRVSEITVGKSLETNLALLKNNANLAAQISRLLLYKDQTFLA